MRDWALNEGEVSHHTEGLQEITRERDFLQAVCGVQQGVPRCDQVWTGAEEGGGGGGHLRSPPCHASCCISTMRGWELHEAEATCATTLRDFKKWRERFVLRAYESMRDGAKSAWQTAEQMQHDNACLVQGLNQHNATG